MKEKIVREEYSFILVDDVKAVVEKLVPHTYKLYVDLTDGEIYIYSRKTITPKLKCIGEIEIRELKLKKHVNLITKEIKQIIDKYIKNRTLMCKTKAIDTYGGKIAVGIDVRDGRVRTRGWLENSKANYIDFAKHMESVGVKNIIVTDISRDGTLKGPNVEMLKKLKKYVQINITASGGVS